MAAMIDLLLDEDFDLMVKEGDFALGDGTEQHKACLLLAHKGHYKQHPVVGVGLTRYLNDAGSDPESEIELQWRLDGMEVEAISVSPQGVLTQVASYPDDIQKEEEAPQERGKKVSVELSYRTVAHQNMMDHAIELTGALDGLIDVLEANAQNLDWQLAAGSTIIDAGVVYDQRLIDFLRSTVGRIGSGDISAGEEFNYNYNDDYN